MKINKKEKALILLVSFLVISYFLYSSVKTYQPSNTKNSNEIITESEEEKKISCLNEEQTQNSECLFIGCNTLF